jgi:hypothetical protein
MAELIVMLVKNIGRKELSKCYEGDHIRLEQNKKCMNWLIKTK